MTGLVQQASVTWAGSSQGSTKVVTLPSAATVGDLVVVEVSFALDALTGVTGLGATWTEVLSREPSSSNFPTASLWYAVVVTAGTTVTLTPNSGFTIGSGKAIARQYAGLSGSVRSSSTTNAQNSTATRACPALTATAGDLYVAVATQDSTATATSLSQSPGAFNATENSLNSYGGGGNDSAMVSGYRIATGPETVQLTGNYAAAHNGIAVAAVFSVKGSPSYSAEVLADSPLVYYRLGESSGTTAVDSSGNAHDGTYVGSPTLGVRGLADDSDTAVTVAAASSQSVTSSSSGVGGLSNAMFEWLVRSPSSSVHMRDDTLSGGTGWFVNLSGSAVALRIGGTDFTTTYTTSGLQDGALHQVVWGADATTAYLYVDGALAWSAARSGGTTTTAPFHLGVNGQNAQYSSGTYDEWAIYGSLSAVRVARHWAALSPYAKAVLLDSPAAYWRLNDPASSVAVDVTGSHSGTWGGTRVAAVAPTGGGTTFNGSTTKMDSGWTWPSLSAWSVEFWINGPGTNGKRMVANCHNDSSDNGPIQVAGGPSGTQIQVCAGAGSTSLSFTAVTVRATGWTPVVLVWNGTDFRTYVDGVLVNTQTLSASSSVAPSQFSCGYNPNYNGDFWAGTMAEVAVYQTALSATQVQAHYVAAYGRRPSRQLTRTNRPTLQASRF